MGRAGPLAALLLALLTNGCSERDRGATQASPSAAAARATPVIVAEVEFRQEETRLEAVGTSRALRSVTLFPAVDGEVVQVDFRPGERVVAGDSLLRLDRREEALAVDLARVRVADAERRLKRLDKMRGTGAVTQSDHDDAASALESARIELRRARVALDDRTLVAPFSGHVGISEVDPGDRVDSDSPITTLDDRSALLVSFDVPEALLGKLDVGTPISVTPWQAVRERIDGEIVDLDSRIDPATRTFVARARVPNDDDRLRPGMSFRVALALRGESYPVVPEVGVLWGGDGAYVWRVKDERAERVPVTVVQRRQGRVLVDAPLTRGERVVSEGVQRMREGLLVRFLEPAHGNVPTGTPQ